MSRRRVDERTQTRAAQFAAVLSEILHAQHLGHRELATALGISRFTVDSWTRAGDPALPGAQNLAQLCDFLEQRQSGLGAELATAAQIAWTPAGSTDIPAAPPGLATRKALTNVPAAQDELRWARQ